MAYKYESTSFTVPAGYKKDLEAFVKQIASWVASTFPELTLDRYSSGSEYSYAYFKLGDTGIQLQIGFFNSGSAFYCYCHDNKFWGSGSGATVLEGGTINLQLMVVTGVAVFSTSKFSSNKTYLNSGALAVKEIISGKNYVLCSSPGNSVDSSANKAHFWFPSEYYYADASKKTTSAKVSVFPGGISDLAGTISKAENDGSRAAIISPVFYMQNGPLSLLTAAEDAVKLMYANDGGMPTVTNYVPIQVGNDQYVALESTNVGSVYLKVN